MGKGLLKYNVKTKTSKWYNSKSNGLVNNLVFDMVYDHRGTLWVATAGSGIHYLNDDDSFSTIHNTNSDASNMDGFRKTLLINGDDLWIATEGSGVHQMDIINKTFFTYKEGGKIQDLSSNIIRDICLSDNEKIYVATDGGGLNIIDPLTNEVSKFYKDNSADYHLNSNALQCLFLDRKNNLWIGTFNGGLNILKKNKTYFERFTPSSENTKNTNHSILAIAESTDGAIWAGTDGSGLFELHNGGSLKSVKEFAYDYKEPKGIGGNVIKTILEDRKKNMWLGMYGTGLDRYDRFSNTFTHFKNDPTDIFSLSSNNVWTIAESDNGDLWIGTIGNGLNIFNPDSGKFKNINNDDFFKDAGTEIMHILMTKEKIWIAEANDGLISYDKKNNTFTTLKHNPDDPKSISNNEIRSLFLSKTADLWIGTEEGGLNKLEEDGSFTRIQKKDGLIANNVMGITEDDQNNLWVSTFDGISMINLGTSEIRNFPFHTRENNQFNQMSILKTSQNQLLFGGINGLNYIQPSEVSPNVFKNDIVFTTLLINNEKIVNDPDILNKPIELASDITLNHNTKSFTLNFADFDFSQSDEKLYRYKLNGFDEKWNYLERGNFSINYTNIDAGKYSLEITNNDVSKNLTIYIKQSFWKSFWFKLIVALIISALLLSAMYFYEQRTKDIHNRQLLDAERQILELKNKNLAAQINSKNSKLLFSSTQMAHKNEILSSVKEDLKELIINPKVNISKTIRKLDRELESEDYWKEFNLYFNEVDTKFIDSIVFKHKNLTQNDVRLCGLLRLNLSTKEISTLLNVSIRGVEKSKYRLKKRLELTPEEDLLQYIRNFLKT